MAVRIKFDNSHEPQQPTFVLANRNGNKIGCIPAININFGDHLNAASELQFRVPREENGVVCAIWDDILDFKLVWCPEWDEWFEIKVDVTDGDHIAKNITATSVGEAELSQINLYDIEINTELDISRDDYVRTVLYNPDKPEGSLLHRITDKAPHYSIGHVDDSIANIQRTFEFDGTSILDALIEIGEEIDCLFIIDSGSNEDGGVARTINAYDLESVCRSCGRRGVYGGGCPECGSDDVHYGYGENTNIYISSENLTDEITYTSNTDTVKNCFRLVAGDDLMTATVASCNPSGSGYLWYFTDEMKSDMSSELRQKLEEYDATYQYFANEHNFELPGALLTRYNALIDKYRAYREDLENLESPIVGYPALMNAYYDVIDLHMYLENEMMPSVELSPTTAADEAAKLTSGALSPTAVTKLDGCSSATASSAVLEVAKQIVDNGYQVKVDTGVLSGHRWHGKFIVTNYSDEEDTATSELAYVTITDDIQTYLNQRINKVLNERVDELADLGKLFKSELPVFRTEIRRYCLNSLNSMRDACQACLDILIEQGAADNKSWANTTPNIYEEIYLPYYFKLSALIDEVALREKEIETVAGRHDENGGLLADGVQTIIEHRNEGVQRRLNLENYLGEQLMKEFASYRREDTYENSNFVSDGLNNQEIFANAREFIELANAEIYKSATLQHTITSTLKNLLVMKEFALITEAFEVGNWLTICVAGKLYRLRLMSYEIDFDNLENLSVEFSDVVKTVYGMNDVQSILKSASSMSSSYNGVQRQASRGAESHAELQNFRENGIALDRTKIINDAGNQGVVMDSHGLLFREKLPYDDGYDPKQVKIINKGLFLTDDNWETSRAGIGSFRYFDPADQKTKEGYGVIADTLIGHLMLSENVGIYNEDNTIRLDNDGFTLVSTSGNKTVFRIQQRYTDHGREVTKDVIYFDNEGNAHFNGNINSSSTIGEKTIEDLMAEIDGTIMDVEIQYAQNQSSAVPPDADSPDWSKDPPAHREGCYIWQRMLVNTTDPSAQPIYSTPVCISGRDGTSVTITDVEYAKNQSGTTEPSSGWQSTIPSVSQGWWLWNRITYSDGTTVLGNTYVAKDAPPTGAEIATIEEVEQALGL